MDNYREKMPPKEDASSSGRIVDKLAKELDKNNVISPPDLHPLLIDHVVQNIMTFLNVKDLKSARLVCKLWAAEGGERILMKSYWSPKFNSSELTEEELTEFLSLAKSSSMFKLFSKNQDILSILERFPKLVERVRALKYETDAPHELWRLAKVLEKLPNLRILDTNDLSLQSFSIYRGGWNPSLIARNREVYQFYHKLESLEEIRFAFPFSSDNQIPMELGGRLKNVTQIMLADPDVQTVDSLIADELQWPLTHITLKFLNDSRQIHSNSIRQFFLKYSNTLKHLEIEMPAYSFRLYQRTPWIDDWLIPVNLLVLETMIISGSGENVWSLLIIALRLPRLKKLVLARIPYDVDEKIRQWEEHPLAAGKKLKSLSIQEVELTGRFQSPSYMLLKGNLWPNLKSLKGLERLEIIIPLGSSPRELQLFQQWLMGAEIQRDFKTKTLIVKKSDISSTSPPFKLGDLKNLKCLTLRVPPEFLLDNVLIYDCLGFMKNLQSLRFNYKSVLSTEALDHLKEALGDIVSFLHED